MKATGIFQVSKWDEAHPGAAISRVAAIFDATGEINGSFQVEYVMHTAAQDPDDPHQAQATYVGYLVFTGEIFDRSGSFVLEDKGSYSPQGSSSVVSSVPGTGTDGFEGATVTGAYYQRDGQMVIELDITLVQ